MSTPVHPAQAAGLRSAELAMAKNKSAWLALYADDAVVQDPVGISPLDATGEGHRGKQALGRFWDMAIAPGELTMRIRESYPAGDECANVVTITNQLPAGGSVTTDCVIVYRVDREGLIVSLKAYWEFAKIAAQLQKLLGK
ncbi:MAG TPA: nuclear transport factor 2 family protein [Steroidobacteraceae bacterium]|nr:nuclear transport factor 2 family protein [Steroidobacteraceae bacterium]